MKMRREGNVLLTELTLMEIMNRIIVGGLLLNNKQTI